MIRLLQGSIYSKEDKRIILMVNGVGYDVYVSNSEDLDLKEEWTLHIYTHVREDAFKLFGFKSKEELQFFELLIGINGVGPKMALEILNHPASIIQNAIATGDIPTLTKIPGVGKKTAERIILELKSKLELIPTNGLETPGSNLQSQSLDSDAIDALEMLGYKRIHIQKILESQDLSEKNTEEIIRHFLSQV
jgi:Holliday junction DNA helicase RuvA